MIAPVSAVSPPRWELYRLLAEPTRLRLLALAEEEELAVSELAELLRLRTPKASRHASALREAGLLRARKQGTWLLLRLAPDARRDPVVADALAAGRASCHRDGTLARLVDVVAARDQATRAFFAEGGRTISEGPPTELAAYLAVLAPMVAPHHLAVDVGTGDGALLEVLAPVFDSVVAVDRADAQLSLARARVARRQFDNVHLVRGEVDGAEVAAAMRCVGADRGADAVFAARVLHHAPQPARALRALASLARLPDAGVERAGGHVLLLDYAAHRDEALREQQADLWLGFEPSELTEMAHAAGLVDVHVRALPAPWCGDGPDRHLPWQMLTSRRGPLEDSPLSPNCQEPIQP